ncbi:hypothetical protein A9Q84_14770 [Halobacteriovorax marinus]|uniref:DNA alkylation repair protein n=1 Tax=Halobacteriovorax marinus TaxID=97084 RepID=A0A1Y5F531_9BACT|nr:hypothetical protein A9Q84_14770 [Halobacteriovorax marinus]
MSKETFLMKDSINPKVVKELSLRIKKHYKNFEDVQFSKVIIKDLKKLELKERVYLVSQSLHKYLPSDFKKSVSILIKSLPEALPNNSKEIEGYGESKLKSLHGFIMISITNYVSEFGIDDFKTSMDALYIMTSRFSAEEAARYFIKEYPKETLKLYKKWSKDKDMHVRRLVTESTRPRLPWTMQLPRFIDDPTPVLPLLESLKNDKELYVRRSIANNLNDISKDNPQIVIRILEEWNKDRSSNMQWLIKHALRTLIKQGNTEALKILGFNKNFKATVKSLRLDDSKVKLGSSLNFGVEVESTSNQEQWLMIDYVIHHMKANGKLTPKVFKLRKVKIKAGEKIVFSKKHSIKEISTRKYYSGEHQVQLMINGNLYPKVKFELNCK